MDEGREITGPEDSRDGFKVPDFFAPLSFLWPVAIFFPVLLFVLRLPGGEGTSRAIRIFIGTFYFWLPFYLMYLAVFALLTSLRAGTWSSAAISAAVALFFLACSWFMLSGIVLRLL